MRSIRYWMKPVLLLILAVGALMVPHTGAAAGTPWYEDKGDHIDLHNDDATWTIYKSCSTNGVGPGYVARVVLNNNGNTLVNDIDPDPAQFPGGASSEARSIGLGKFIWRDARAKQLDALYYNANQLNAWPVSNRCYSDRDTFFSETGPFGGQSASIPRITSGTDGHGVYVEYYQVVHLRDLYSPLLDISYKWRVYPTIVRMWAYIISTCPYGTCTTTPTGRPRAWVKGPKFIAGINGAPDGPRFTRLTSYDSHGTAVCGFDRSVSAGSSATGQCPSNNQTDPQTGQPCTNSGVTYCPGRDRARVEFDYAVPVGSENPTSGNPGCHDTQRCFEAVFRGYNAYPYSFPDFYVGDSGLIVLTYPWDGDGGGVGLQGWAVNASSRLPEDPNNGCPTSGKTVTDPLDPAVTRWESVGYKTNPTDPTKPYTGSYASAAAFAFGWEDCRNVGDTNYAGALYRAYPYKPDAYGANAYGTFASFSFKGDAAFDNVEALH